jgi:long-subunit fatty acid transport protein
MRSNRWLAVGLRALLALGLASAPARAQTPPLERIGQDELDLQAQASVIQGSGARAFGMGGAFLARADDATAASWNPAGLSYLRRPEVSLVWAAINRLESRTLNPDNTLNTEDNSHGNAPDFAAVTYPFELFALTGAVQLSFQRVIPFTGHRTIVRALEGRPDATTVRSVDSEGGFDVLALGSGVQVTRKLRLGLTVNRWINGYHRVLERQGPRPNRLDVDFDFRGWNANAGLIVSPLEDFNIGLVGKLQFSGDVRLRRFRSDVDNNGVTVTNTATRSDVQLRFPGAWGVGASWRPRNNLTVSADFTQTFWSNGQIRNYFTLPPKTQEEEPSVFDVLPYPLFDTTRGTEVDTLQIRTGAEYVIIGHGLKIPVRAGYFTDRQYFPAAGGRAPVFHGWTAGTGVILGPVLLDVAYVHEWGHYADYVVSDRSVSVKPRRAYVSLIYRHGAR